MGRTFRTVMTAVALATTTLAAQQARFPDTPQGKLAAGFFAAVGNPDERVLSQFHEANFSKSALERRSAEERQARNRDLRERAGVLSLVQVVSESASQLSVKATGANAPGVTLLVTFTFTSGAPVKIESLQIQSQ
jgi:hypothetical protein